MQAFIGGGGRGLKRVMILSFVFFLGIFTSLVSANSNDQAVEVFQKELEKKLQMENAYYHSNTVNFESTTSFQGEVTKIIKQDDPKTEANEQKLEIYTSNLIIGFASYEEIRGNLFTFEKKEFHYYDLDKEEFLTSQNVMQNQQAEEFFQKNMDNVGKEKTIKTHIIITLLMLLLILVPWLIGLIHSKRMGPPPKVFTY